MHIYNALSYPFRIVLSANFAVGRRPPLLVLKTSAVFVCRGRVVVMTPTAAFGSDDSLRTEYIVVAASSVRRVQYALTVRTMCAQVAILCHIVCVVR